MEELRWQIEIPPESRRRDMVEEKKELVRFEIDFEVDLDVLSELSENY